MISLLAAADETLSVLTATQNGYGKRTPIAEYTRHGRGTQGMIAIQCSERNGKLVAAQLVGAEDEIMLITTGGVLIRTRVAEIRELGRSTQGVRLINLGENEALAGLEKIVEPRGTATNGERQRRRRRTQRRRRRRLRRPTRRDDPRRAGATARTDSETNLMARVFNFSAGPAVLPEPVLAQAAQEMLDWHGSGMSVMEMSHRGKEFIAIPAQAEADLRELLAIPTNYKVLFLQGGAAAQFAMMPMNLLRGKTRADYVNTGQWSKKAITEAKKYCKVNVAASSEDRELHATCRSSRRGSSIRTRPTCTSRPTRRSAASSSTGRPIPARCRWWPTRLRTSCRGRST